jgi:hypothetical protein
MDSAERHKYGVHSQGYRTSRNVQTYSNPASDIYGFNLSGFTGYVSGNSFTDQPGASPLAGVSLINSGMTYWFVSNARRIAAVIKVSSVYEALYLGLIKPYATPGQYPYPLFVGGSTTGGTLSRWSSTSNAHSHYFNPQLNQQSKTQSASLIRTPGGSWQNLAYLNVSPYDAINFVPLVLPSPGDYYALTSIIMFDGVSTYGEFDGLFHVTGFANASENIVSIDSSTYLVFQNVFRTSPDQYAALKLT